VRVECVYVRPQVLNCFKCLPGEQDVSCEILADLAAFQVCAITRVANKAVESRSKCVSVGYQAGGERETLTACRFGYSRLPTWIWGMPQSWCRPPQSAPHGLTSLPESHHRHDTYSRTLHKPSSKTRERIACDFLPRVFFPPLFPNRPAPGSRPALPMAPAKSRTAHDEAKSETPNSKEKNGHATAGQHSNGKARRVASAAGSQLRDVTNATSLPPTAASAPPAAAAAAAAAPEITNPGVSPQRHSPGSAVSD